MKYAHAIKLRVIVSPEEEDVVKRKVKALLGLPLDEVDEEEDVSFSVDEAEDFEGNELRLVRTEFRKTRNTNRVLATLREELSRGDREMIAGQMDRLDDELNFHVRLDLDAFLDDVFIVTEGGDCVHLRVKVAAYPAKPVRAKPVIEEMLGVSEG